MLKAALKFDAGFGGILHTEAAELRSDASLHHTDAFSVGLARGHSEVRPNFRQVGFFDAEEIDTLAACDFDHRHVVFFRDVGYAAKFFSGSDAAAHARDDGESAIFLNVGVDAVIDETRRAVFIVITAPDDIHHVAERWLADFAAGTVAVDVENFLNGKDALAADDVAQFLFAVRQALAQSFRGLFLEFADDGS